MFDIQQWHTDTHTHIVLFNVFQLNAHAQFSLFLSIQNCIHSLLYTISSFSQTHFFFISKLNSFASSVIVVKPNRNHKIYCSVVIFSQDLINDPKLNLWVQTTNKQQNSKTKMSKYRMASSVNLEIDSIIRRTLERGYHMRQMAFYSRAWFYSFSFYFYFYLLENKIDTQILILYKCFGICTTHFNYKENEK